MNYRFITIEDRQEAINAAVEILQADLDLTIEKRGNARLMLSGGSSPKPIYEALSQAELDWSQVAIGLVDERWVPQGHSASNASFIKNSLLQNKASAATFLPMTNEAATAREGQDSISADYLLMGQPYDICVMGMGTDGHTASWFPDSPDLHNCLDMAGQKVCLAVDASECDGAGDVRERITLSRPAVLAASTLLLFISGHAKLDVFKQAQKNYETGNLTDLPVASLMDAGERLIVIWSP